MHELTDDLNTVPLVIISSANARNRFKDSDATFVFEKPISVEQAVHTLSAARNMILDGRLRYHRAGLEVPVTLSGRHRKRVGAQLINLSQGGLQVRMNEGFDANDLQRACFDLPGTKCGV